MKRFLLFALLIMSCRLSFADCGFPQPNNACIYYDAVTGKMTVKMYVSYEPGKCVDYYVGYKDFNYMTGEYVYTKSYLSIYNPLTGTYLGPFPLTTSVRLTSGGTFSGYDLYYDISIPAFSAQDCYAMYILSDREVPYTYAPWVPTPGLDPTIPIAYMGYPIMMTSTEVCTCPDIPEDDCNAMFNFRINKHPVVAPKFVGEIYMDDYHPLSTYTYDWGDGTITTIPYSHVYNPGPFSPGNYTVCVTEHTPDGQSCTYCMDFCAPVGYVGGSSSMKKGKTEDIKTVDYPSQIYPNPTNGNSEIRFNLKENQQVEVSVLDITGKVVSKPESKEYQEGNNKFQILTGNLPNGMYQVRLKKGKETEILKLSIAR